MYQNFYILFFPLKGKQFLLFRCMLFSQWFSDLDEMKITFLYAFHANIYIFWHGMKWNSHVCKSEVFTKYEFNYQTFTGWPQNGLWLDDDMYHEIISNTRALLVSFRLTSWPHLIEKIIIFLHSEITSSITTLVMILKFFHDEN